VYGEAVTLELRAQDSDGHVASVVVTANDQPVATLARAPYVVAWRPPAPGSYAVSARAVDDQGAASLPAMLRFTVTATEARLQVVVSGEGQVTSEPAGISCPSDCTGRFVSGTPVTLSALASDGSTFVGWEGDCADTSGEHCTVTTLQARQVIARFQPISLEIAPTAAQVAVRERLELTATAVGVAAQDLVWQTSAGTIAADGFSAVLTAPATPETVTVTVSSAAAPSVQAQAVVTVFEGLAERFMLVVLPDTQNYLCSTCPPEADKWHPATFKAQTQWVVDNQSAQAIAFVSHVGDVVDQADQPDEWREADSALALLAGHVPHAVAIGDHDFFPEEVRDPAAALNTSYYRQYFGSARYQGQRWYVGASPNDLSHAQLFEAGGRRFLHIALEWEAPDAAIDWAASVIRAYPQVPTILSTHAYVSNVTRGHSTTTEATLQTGEPDPTANSGRDIYTKLIVPHPQIFMVLNGHYHNTRKNLGAEDEDGEWHQMSQNSAGTAVFEMLSNYQDFQNGGDGWLRTIEFIPGGGSGGQDRIQMRTYSPTRDQFRTGPYSQFYFDLSFAERFDR
jgi:hypothetical protein